MSKVSEEIAEQELSIWFEKNHISEEKIEAYSDSAKVIKKGICKGNLVLNEDGKLTQKLISPIGAKSNPINEITFNARVNRKMVVPHLNGVKSGDADMRLVAYMAASTGITKSVLLDLMPEDQVLADNITVFFVN